MSRSLAFMLFATCVLARSFALGDEPSSSVPKFALELPHIDSGPPAFEFNGKDLTGFYTFTRDHKYADPKKVFTVVDGAVRISGEEFGGLATCGNFGNYHLLTEWKWGTKTWPPRTDKARDSGILVHCVGPDGAALGHWMESQECQIIEGGAGDFIMVRGLGKPSLTCETRTGPDNQPYFEKGGTPVTRNSGRYNWWGRDPHWKDVLGFRGRRDVEKPTGEWNRMDVICDRDSITVYLNRRLVNVGTKSSLTMGKILFQSEGAEIFFRRIEIRPLMNSGLSRVGASTEGTGAPDRTEASRRTDLSSSALILFGRLLLDGWGKFVIPRSQQEEVVFNAHPDPKPHQVN